MKVCFLIGTYSMSTLEKVKYLQTQSMFLKKRIVLRLEDGTPAAHFVRANIHSRWTMLFSYVYVQAIGGRANISKIANDNSIFNQLKIFLSLIIYIDMYSVYIYMYIYLNMYIYIIVMNYYIMILQMTGLFWWFPRWRWILKWVYYINHKQIETWLDVWLFCMTSKCYVFWITLC
jgi:hypothetical protein